MTNRYMTPIKYKDGNQKERTAKLYFELDPIELLDWTFEHPFEANELLASLIELQEIEKQESRDLTQDEIRTMLGMIKILSELSAGRPTDDGEYFVKDPNWTSSYKYRGFREFLMTNPKEVEQFLTQLLDNNVMEEFADAITKANSNLEAEAAEVPTKPGGGQPSQEELIAAWKAKEAEKAAANASQATVDGSDNA